MFRLRSCAEEGWKKQHLPRHRESDVAMRNSKSPRAVTSGSTAKKAPESASIKNTFDTRMIDKIFNRGFQSGMAYAVAELLRDGYVSSAEEIWLAGCGSKSVPSYIDAFDANPIKKAIKSNWGRKA